LLAFLLAFLLGSDGAIGILSKNRARLYFDIKRFKKIYV